VRTGVFAIARTGAANGADDASNRLTREEPLKDIEGDVPPAAPHEMKMRSMLCHSVRRVPPPNSSSLSPELASHPSLPTA
jgi:hypothetical protein